LNKEVRGSWGCRGGNLGGGRCKTATKVERAAVGKKEVWKPKTQLAGAGVSERKKKKKEETGGTGLEKRSQTGQQEKGGGEAVK